ncbi:MULTISPECIES: cyclic-di-AMP-binding protein CbpB [Bacillaceae]|uniref:CBS domain-containing protein n=1 Tax=Evansella alkalicola TaxID=745819 RepID=A0ABS6K187_9BACI|nr:MULTISPECIES: cyclic-di-AMP-binding protein CbpB [Bacillaceae]MBU9724066.1 CBS domain-containing protein [Bacillus alkalicola]
MQKIDESSILEVPITTFMISIDEVAHVQPDNSLEHALLILVKSGYTSIPVLDTQFKLQGLISKAQILDSIIGLERMEPERLQNTLVSDVMTTSIARVKNNEKLERVLSYSINHPFICVEDMEEAFLGIITRSKLLAYLNGHFHELKKKQRN